MGKIFGISNNPVSTIDSALRTLKLEPPVQSVRIIRQKNSFPKAEQTVSRANCSNYFIKMRNGFGKLMAHFSPPNISVKK